MQDKEKKILLFKKAVGEVIRELRQEFPKVSMSRLAMEYDIDKGSLSRLERGLMECYVSTLWKIAEATGVKFSEIAQRIEEKLGSEFKFMDE